MKKQLLVLVLACSAIGSAYAGDKDYSRPLHFLQGAGKTGLSALLAYAAWKNVTEGSGHFCLFDKVELNWRQALIASSVWLGYDGLKDLYKSSCSVETTYK